MRNASERERTTAGRLRKQDSRDSDGVWKLSALPSQQTSDSTDAEYAATNKQHNGSGADSGRGLVAALIGIAAWSLLIIVVP